MIVPEGVFEVDRADIRTECVVELPPARDDLDWRRRAGSAAVTDFGADWVIPVGVGEFWWPRASSLKEVFEPVPPRYGVVQALLRPLLPDPDARSDTACRDVIRPVLLPGGADASRPRTDLLRKAFRAHPGLDLAVDDGGPGTAQPLRAWYPIEVFRVGGSSPSSSPEQIVRGIDEGALTVDRRLAEMLAELTTGARGADGSSRGGASFRVPNVVEDAAYAVECAAICEVDATALDKQIRDLEARITWLEARLWPRMLRRASNLAHGRLRRPS